MNKILLALAVSVLVSSCGHTNKLAQYNVRSQPFEMFSDANTAGSATSSVNSGSHNAVSDIIAGLSSGSLSQSTADRLRRAANADSLAAHIGRQFDEAIMSYLAVAPSPVNNPNAAYRAVTQLENYSLSSDSTGIAAHISATSRIIQRSSGVLVWEYTSSKDIPLSTTTSNLASGRAMLSAVNAASLASMSDDEMASIFYSAAQAIGADIAETLRQDVAALAKQ